MQTRRENTMTEYNFAFKENEELSGSQAFNLSDSEERIKFWDIESCFTCPIVGMCLTVPEQKQILKKTEFPIKKTSLYEIHEALVVSGESENKISRRVDALLERKFSKEVAPLFALDDKAFMAHFKTAFKTGDYLALLWAAAVNPKLSLASKRVVFGEIHMSMHWGGDESRKMKQKVIRLNDLIKKMNGEMREGKRRIKKVKKENDEMTRELARLKQENRSLKKENETLQEKVLALKGTSEMLALEKRNRELEESLAHMADSYGDAKAQLHSLSEKREQLIVELKLQKKLTEEVTQEARKVIGQVVALTQCFCDESCSCDASCPAFDLCQKRVLIVGGISRMESVYREFIEGSGGRFDYHDGYMRNGVKPLEDRMKRADMVLCPVNCNSHTACAVVKKLGKKHKKNVHMLHNYSLSAVSQVIQDATAYGGERAVGTFGF